MVALISEFCPGCPDPNTSPSVSSPPRILFIDDDADVQKAAALLLRSRGFLLHEARSPEEAWSLLAAEPIDAVLLDLNFHRGATTGAEGLRFLKELITYDREASVVVVTGHSGVSIAVAAMRAGAKDFVMKPWNNDKLIAVLSEAVKLRREQRCTRLCNASATRQDLEWEKPVGDSPALQLALDIACRVAPTPASVLLLGEIGTGKTSLGRVIYRLSQRPASLLTVIHPALDERSFSAALGAIRPGATIFLDDIERLPPAWQGNLVEALKSHLYFRLIATTRKTRRELQDGVLETELLYRLNTVEVFLPPVRDRGCDSRLLAEHFLRLFAQRYNRGAMTLLEAAAEAIVSNLWPGNVREIRQAIERAVVLAQGRALHAEDILAVGQDEQGCRDGRAGVRDLTLAQTEKAIVAAALRRHGFNVSHAAKELGLTRAALYRRMARHGL